MFADGMDTRIFVPDHTEQTYYEIDGVEYPEGKTLESTGRAYEIYKKDVGRTVMDVMAEWMHQGDTSFHPEIIDNYNAAFRQFKEKVNSGQVVITQEISR